MDEFILDRDDGKILGEGCGLSLVPQWGGRLGGEDWDSECQVHKQAAPLPRRSWRPMCCNCCRASGRFAFLYY